LWVFIFFDGGLLTCPASFLITITILISRACLGLDRRHEHDHGPAFHARRLLDSAVRPELIGKLVQQSLTNIRMRHLSTTEQDSELDLIASVEEPRRLSPLRLQVVVVDLRPDAHLFQLDNVLIAARLTIFPALLIAKFAVIHQSTDGRNGIRRNLDQIEAPLTRHLERVERQNDANLPALLIDEPNLAEPDALIDAGLDGSGNNLPPLPNLVQHRNAPGKRSGAVAQIPAISLAPG